MASDTVNEFGQDLLLQWRKDHPDESIVFSPLSLAAAFYLLYKGASGKTKQELDAVFGFGNAAATQTLAAKFERLASGSRDVAQERSTDSVSLMANRIYVEKAYPLEPDYATTTGPENIVSVDFQHAAESVMQEINGWVSDRTEGLIADLVKPGSLSEVTVMIVINALYFKGGWEMPFSLFATRPKPFHGVHGEEQVPFMSLSGEYIPVKKLPELDSLLFEMPYMGRRFGMFVLLPKQREGWRNAEQQLRRHLSGLFTDGFETMVSRLEMPKWQMETEVNELDVLLKQLGMNSIYTDAADFSNISRHPFKLSAVIHKAKITVNEKGTEAAAASMGNFANRSSPPLNLETVVDRPFLYFIVDHLDGSVLFQGSMTSFH